MDRTQYRREIGPVSSGYDMADIQLTISHKSIEESQINESDYEPDAWIAVECVVNNWIRCSRYEAS